MAKGPVGQLTRPIASLIATFFVIAAVTTFVLPNRPSPEVIQAFFNGLTEAIKATLGLTIPTAIPAPSKPTASTSSGLQPADILGGMQFKEGGISPPGTSANVFRR